MLRPLPDPGLPWVNANLRPTEPFAAYMQSANPILSNGRETLSASRNYYVRSDGSDSNIGTANTAGGAFLTGQKAIDTAAALDLSLYGVTIQFGSGTHTGALVLKSYLGVGPINLLGDTTTPSNVVISTTSANCITMDGVIGAYTLGGFKLQTTTSGNCISVTNNSNLTISGKMNYGACAGIHISEVFGGTIRYTADYTISGGAIAHMLLQLQAVLSTTTLTVTLSGTPAFSFCFAYADFGSQIAFSGVTFSGAATGKRYLVASNAIINTGFAGPNFLPGNAAGTESDGGRYL